MEFESIKALTSESDGLRSISFSTSLLPRRCSRSCLRCCSVLRLSSLHQAEFKALFVFLILQCLLLTETLAYVQLHLAYLQKASGLNTWTMQVIV